MRAPAWSIYNGHSHHWQYARTTEDPSAPVQWFLDLSDAAVRLQNNDRYFIGLAMTCYTSQFPKPANAGTLDELLLRNPNAGAVAIFGPAGTTVAHGHDYLQKGFIERLRATDRMSLRLGELVEASFTNLLLNGSPFYFDSLKTFLLLGDPLTRARISAGSKTGLFLPLIER